MKFKRVCIVHNPASTHADRANKMAKDLKKALAKSQLKTVETSKSGKSATKALFTEVARGFDSGTLLAIGGGDGTVSSLIEVLVTSNELSSDNKRVVVLPLWGGNANDLAVMLNGLVRGRGFSFERVINDGKVVKIYPLRLKFSPDVGKSYERLALCYASFGTSAHATWLMEGSSHVRDNKSLNSPVVRFGAEIVDMLKAVLKAPAFFIESEGKAEKMYERIFVNGPRIAKIERLPVSLSRREYYEASANKKHFHILIYAVKALVGRNYGRVHARSQRFIIKDKTRAQIDGENFELAANTEVEISINDTPFYALSTKL